jgi:uncharacterized protein (TIGR03435 family)
MAIAALSMCSGPVSAQSAQDAGTQPSKPPEFDVVSIRRNLGTSPQNNYQPTLDGGFTMSGTSLMILIIQAYPGIALADFIGVPDWVRTEFYDVTAKTAPGSGRTTRELHAARLQALLAERLRFSAHRDTRAVEAYDLVVARADRKLGPSLTRLEVNCRKEAADRGAAIAAAAAAGTAPPPPPPIPASGKLPACMIRGGTTVFEGPASMTSLASALRTMVGRPVVDKTGLTGDFHVKLEAAPVTENVNLLPRQSADLPFVFDAVRDQLGLKLVPSRTTVDVLVIDRMERPSEN